MRLELTNKVRKALLSRGALLDRVADPARVAALIESLWPVRTRHDLIRLGAASDGGYLVPDDLDGVTACFSPGVDDRASFELDLAARGIRSLLIDASVSACPVDHPLLAFEPLYLDAYSAGNRTSLADWMARSVSPDENDLILQMDIEGYEYAALLSLPEDQLKRFRIMVLELHNVEFLFTVPGLCLFESLFGRLAQHFHIVHAHPNNASRVYRYKDAATCGLMELTLLRKDRGDALGPATAIPHPLDARCVDHTPELTLHDALSPRPQF